MTIKHLFPKAKPVLNLDFANARELDRRITFTRASIATYVGSDRLIKTAASGEARFDHDPATGESLGLLIEEARTNLWLDSDDPTKKDLVGVSCTLDPSVLDPLGNSSAKIEITAVQTYQNWRQTGFSLTSGTYTFSVYLKAGTISSVTLSSGGNQPNAKFDIANGTVTSETGCTAEVQPAANGWFRCSITWTATSTTEIRTWTTVEPVGGYYFVAAAQVEAGSFPTSYIPTSGSTETRAADVANITGTNFSSWYNQSEGTFFWEGTPQFASTNEAVLALHDGSTSNRISFRPRNTLVDTLGASQLLLSLSAGDAPSNTKLAYALALDASGGTVLNRLGSDTGSKAISMPALTQMEINRVEPSGSIHTTGHVSRIAYYPTRLSDDQLQALAL